MTILNRFRFLGAPLIVLLALTAVGCGGKRGAARKACRALYECDNDFDEQYSSKGDCIDEWVEDIEDLEEDQGKECAQAFIDLIRCAAPEYQDDCRYFEAILDDCEEDYEVYEDECSSNGLEIEAF